VVRAWALRIAFLVLFCAVSIAALIPPGESNASPVWMPNDKILHVGAYGILSINALLAFPRRPVWLIGAGLILHGAAIERVQPVMSRVSDPTDLLADLAGVVLGSATIYAWRMLRGAPR
jgi:VanZ family protein